MGRQGQKKSGNKEAEHVAPDEKQPLVFEDDVLPFGVLHLNAERELMAGESTERVVEELGGVINRAPRFFRKEMAGLNIAKAAAKFLRTKVASTFVREDPQWLEGALLYPWSRDAAAILFITAVFWRNQMKYGERGYRYILQESGHLGQNIYLVSEALGLQCCALGGFADEEIDRLLDIDGVTEATVYAFAVGPRTKNEERDDRRYP